MITLTVFGRDFHHLYDWCFALIRLRRESLNPPPVHVHAVFVTNLLCFQFVGVEGVVTTIVDQYPHLLRKGYRKEVFIGIICIIMFFVGLSMVSNVSRFGGSGGGVGD